MAYDQQLANAISNTFRATCVTRLTTPQRGFFEQLLTAWFGLKNIRNAQLWTRFGSQTRNIINRNLGEFELDMRVFIADRFIQSVPPNFVVKTKFWRMPPDDEIARKTFEWFQDPYIRAYTTRIFFDGLYFILEYAAESDIESETIDLDSPEFEDLVDDD